MQSQPRYSLIRRLLYPYSGQEALTRAQGARVVITWSLFFPLAFLLGAVIVVPLLHTVSVQRLLLVLLLTFCVGACLFGAMAWFVVYINNRSAQIRQMQNQQRTAQSSSNSGGRYGS